jgi:hypothetical protein
VDSDLAAFPSGDKPPSEATAIPDLVPAEKIEPDSAAENSNALVHAYTKFMQRFSTVLFGFRNCARRHFDTVIASAGVARRIAEIHLLTIDPAGDFRIS